MVCLGLVLSAMGVFSLMSVSVARRTREIGLRLALGATSLRLLARVFMRVAALVGIGILAADVVLGVAFTLGMDTVYAAYVARMLLIASGVMIAAVLLGCVAPARRALQIPPADALKEA